MRAERRLAAEGAQRSPDPDERRHEKHLEDYLSERVLGLPKSY